MKSKICAAIVVSVLGSFLTFADTVSNLTVTGTATLQGNLSVSGTMDLLGNSLYFGTVLSSGSLNGQPGMNALYVDGTTSSFRLIATRPSHAWLWEHATSNLSSTIPMMRLDANHVLTIFDTAGNPAIVLNPAGSNGSTSVLTLQAADTRYVSSSNVSIATDSYDGVPWSNTALGGGTATGWNSFAASAQASATGWANTATGTSIAGGGEASTALGESNASGCWATAAGTSTAYGDYSTAMGNSQAGGQNATALGNSNASGPNSIAIGCSNASCDPSYAEGAIALGRSYAWDIYSTAIGNSIATAGICTALGQSNAHPGGAYSTAMGHSDTWGLGATAMGWSVAQAAFSTVAGRGNIVQGDSYEWVGSDDLLVVGNGTGQQFDEWGNQQYDENGVPCISSNAFVVKKNGDTTVYGKFNVSGSNGSTASTPYGASIAYDDGTNGVNSSITLQSTRPSSTWNWRKVAASGTSTRIAMQFDASNRLILTGTATTDPPQIVLDPNVGFTNAAWGLWVTSGSNVTLGSNDIGGHLISFSGTDGSAYFANGAATIDSNGNAKLANANISGTASVTGGLIVTGTAATVLKTGLIVTGTMDSATNTVVSSGPNQLVLIPQQGDLSMGDFTSGALPQ